MQRFAKPKLYEYITSIGSLAVAGLLLVSTMITGVRPVSPLDALRPRALSSSASEGSPKLGVLVGGGQSGSVQQGGSYTLSFTVASKPWGAGNALDAKYVVCSIVDSSQCGNSIVGPWGNYKTDLASRVTVELPNSIPVGYYVAQFRPRGSSDWGWSDPITVAVYPTTGSVGEKAAFHKFTNLRAGMLRTADGKWNVQDYALHLVNLSSQNIDIYWKLVSDDPNFLFTGGTRGVKTRILPTDAWGYQSLNIAAPEIYSFQVPTYSNFTGSNELIGCVRGSSPCVPAKFYAYMLPHTPVKVGVDANATWFDSWDAWKDIAVPVGLDQDLGSFIVPYTNYWHNVVDWPKGWYSTVSITNNSTASAVYTVKHVPDGYSKRVTETSGCNYQNYSEQTASVTVPAGTTKTMDLQTLFGWSSGTASFAEGYLLVTPPPTVRASTKVTSQVLPGTTGSALCSSHGTWFASVAINITAGTTLQENAVLTARVLQNRGTNISSVKFYADGQFLGEGTVPVQLSGDSTFSLNGSGIASGNHQLVAKIFRGATEIAASSPVAITVQGSAITYNGSDAAIQFGGSGWTNFKPLAGAYNDDEIYTGSAGASASLTVNATRFRVYGAKAYNRGKMEVIIDGQSKAIIDPYSATTQVGVMLFDSGTLSPEQHEIKIVNRSTDRARPFIGLDKITVTQ